MRSTKTISVDDLARKVLPQQENEAFSEVDIEVKEVGAVIKFGGIELKEIEIQFHVRGVHLVAAMLVIGFFSILSQLLLNK
jgi:hypothetical protein